MEQKIIEAQFSKNKIARLALIVGIVLIVSALIWGFIIYSTQEGYTEEFSYGSGWKMVQLPYVEIYDSFGEFVLYYMTSPFDMLFVLIADIGILITLMAVFLILEMSRCALTVTNRRVTGKASFGKSVDLPINQIASVSLGSFNRITVATSSGKVHFWLIENRNDIHTALTDIIGKVQAETTRTQNSGATISSADEMKKYKELLDSGVISQEEFDAKKKQLLGL